MKNEAPAVENVADGKNAVDAAATAELHAREQLAARLEIMKGSRAGVRRNVPGMSA